MKRNTNSSEKNSVYTKKGEPYESKCFHWFAYILYSWEELTRKPNAFRTAVRLVQAPPFPRIRPPPRRRCAPSPSSGRGRGRRVPSVRT